MSEQAKETDKEVLKRVMSEPTFKKIREKMIAENRRREQEIRDLFRDAEPEPK